MSDEQKPEGLRNLRENVKNYPNPKGDECQRVDEAEKQIESTLAEWNK